MKKSQILLYMSTFHIKIQQSSLHVLVAFLLFFSSVAEPEPGAGAAGAASFRAAPEPIFLLVGAGSRSRTF